MAEPKPLAALSASLLARKGAARPAMRPLALGMAETSPEPEPTPQVLVERAALERSLGLAAEDETHATLPLATALRIGRESAAQTSAKKAAFTLRLDGDRHVRLKLAAAITNQSSQHLVTQALDAFLQTLPAVEALVAHLPARTAKS